MSSFFIVNIYFLFSILFFVPDVFAIRNCDSDGICQTGTDPVSSPSVSPKVPKPKPKPKPKAKPPKSDSTPDSSGSSDNSGLTCASVNCPGGMICMESSNGGAHCEATGNCSKFANGQVVCSGDTKPNDSNGNSSEDSYASPQSECMSHYESLMSACRAKIEETSHSCDEKNDSGMNSIMGQASQLTLALGQSTASSIQKSCSDTAALMQGANAALAAYRSTCDSAISDCNSACGEVKKFVVAENSCMSVGAHDMSSVSTDMTQAADNSIQRCNSFESKVSDANQAIQNFAQTMGNAANCQTATAGAPVLGSVQKLCASQPNYPGCNPAAPVDCSKPELATTNKVCICSKNPNDPACLGPQKVGDGNGFGPNLDTGARLSKTDPSGFGGDLPNLPLPDQGNVNATPGKPIDGHQGGNAALGGGDSGSGGGPAGSGGSSSHGTDGSPSGSGFYGGSGGSGMYGSGGSEGGAGGRYAASAGSTGKPNNPDLRQFLPGGKFDPKRGISGMTGPDGITGPHTDIWQKVQNRYQVMSPSLLP